MGFVSILVSCCSDDGNNGGIFRLTRNDQHWQVDKVFEMEVRGLCRFPDHYAITSEHARELMILNGDFQVVKSKQIELGAHGIAYADGFLYHVDTMNDCVRVLTTDLEEVEVIPVRSNPKESSGTDLRHVNDIQLFMHCDTMHLVYTCFRYDLSIFQANQARSDNKRDPKNCRGLGSVAVRDATNSCNLGGMELSGLWQPHSPYYDSSEGKLYVLSSRDSRLVIMEGYQPFDAGQNIREVTIPGFLRGLLVGSDNLYIGKSFLRGESETVCGVYVVDKKELDQQTFIPLPANEVYAIIDER